MLRHAQSLHARLRADEGGAGIIWGLFMFAGILILAGFAVDLMRVEEQRVRVQQTVDRAVLAAADLDQSRDPKTVVEDYFDKAGLRDALVSVTVTEGLNSREVSAEAQVDVPTWLTFIQNPDAFRDRGDGTSERTNENWLSRPVLSYPAPGRGTAREEINDIEISLVVDVSGSMGSRNRLKNLKTAAKEFFDAVAQNDPNSRSLTSVSIIPYNNKVNVGPIVAKRINFDDHHDLSYCSRFREGTFNTSAIGPNTWVERIGHFARHNDNYRQPHHNAFRCPRDDVRHMLLFQTDPEKLKRHIDRFWAGGATAVDQGVKWGAALLDPAFGPIVNTMASKGEVPNSVRGRPAAFDDDETLKVLVLMTDGDNTQQRDLRDHFKGAISPVWYSPSKARQGNWYDGYYVDLNHELTPSNREVPGWRDWYRPRSPWRTSDDEWMGNKPSDAYRLSYQDLLVRFRAEDLALMMWRYADYDTRRNGTRNRPWTWDYSRNRSMWHDHTRDDKADKQQKKMCDVLKQNDSNVLIFTIAFEAPSHAAKVMKSCATSSGHHYDVKGLDIVSAFRSIASQINHLKLTQ